MLGQPRLVQVMAGAREPAAAVDDRVVLHGQLRLDPVQVCDLRGKSALLLEPFVRRRVPVPADGAPAALLAAAHRPRGRGDPPLQGGDRAAEPGAVTPQVFLRRLRGRVVVNTDRARIPGVDPELGGQDLVPVVRLLAPTRGGQVRVPRPGQVRADRGEQVTFIRLKPEPRTDRHAGSWRDHPGRQLGTGPRHTPYCAARHGHFHTSVTPCCRAGHLLSSGSDRGRRPGTPEIRRGPTRGRIALGSGPSALVRGRAWRRVERMGLVVPLPGSPVLRPVQRQADHAGTGAAARDRPRRIGVW